MHLAAGERGAGLGRGPGGVVRGEHASTPALIYGCSVEASAAFMPPRTRQKELHREPHGSHRLPHHRHRRRERHGRRDRPQLRRRRRARGEHGRQRGAGPRGHRGRDRPRPGPRRLPPPRRLRRGRCERPLRRGGRAARRSRCPRPPRRDPSAPGLLERHRRGLGRDVRGERPRHHAGESGRAPPDGREPARLDHQLRFHLRRRRRPSPPHTPPRRAQSTPGPAPRRRPGVRTGCE